MCHLASTGSGGTQEVVFDDFCPGSIIAFRWLLSVYLLFNWAEVRVHCNSWSLPPLSLSPSKGCLWCPRHVLQYNWSGPFWHRRRAILRGRHWGQDWWRPAHLSLCWISTMLSTAVIVRKRTMGWEGEPMLCLELGPWCTVAYMELWRCCKLFETTMTLAIPSATTYGQETGWLVTLSTGWSWEQALSRWECVCQGVCVYVVYRILQNACNTIRCQSSVPYMKASELRKYCLRGECNEIHNVRKPGKPCLIKYISSGWLLKVIKGQKAGKGHTLFSGQTTKGH